jgi:putative aminopeptidase FrvX
MHVVELLRELSDSHGVSGYEAAPREIARRAMEPYVDDVRVDALGNLIAWRRGEQEEGAPRRSIMLAAHIDEIGLMVTGLDAGFIRFTNVGGVDLRTIVGQEVMVHGTRSLPGIVASLPPHVLTAQEREQPIPQEKLFIDIGYAADELKELVSIGDLITLRREMLELSEGYVAGKAFDDRTGVVAMALCLETLSGLRHSWDVYAVATTQEEVGLRGALVSAYGIAPSTAIAIDVGFGQQQGVNEAESIAMDGGPAIAMGPNIHPLMHRRLVSTAKQYELKYQQEVAGGRTGTDAWAIQVTREGIPTALLSIPLRYMHTTVETVCIRDIQRTARLMALFIADLDADFAAELGC